jgi:glycosyltransferase involved in cell wall biosynthesis
MRVLFICSGNTKFGISPFILSQANSLKEQGIEVDFFTIVGKGIRSYIKAAKIYRKESKKHKYDIIHAHYTFSAYVALLGRNKIPIVLSLMGDDAYGTPNAKGKTKVSSYYSILLTLLIQPFMKAIIAKSEQLGSYVYLKRKLSIIPNGVNMNDFIPISQDKAKLDLGLELDKKYVLFLNNTKDIRKNFKLLANTIKNQEIDDFELLTPYPVSHSDVIKYLSAADLLVHTSLREGSPNLIKEAMAMNCPIVTTKVGDVEQLLHGVDNCYLCDFDEKDLATKINKVLRSNRRSDSRSKMAFLQHDVIAKQIISVYNKALRK